MKNHSAPVSDFRWALDRLGEFNAIVLGDAGLREIFVLNDWNFLQAYQAQIFFDFVDYYKKNQTGAAAHTWTSAQSFESSRESSPSGASVRVRFRQLVALAISIISYIFLLVSRRPVLVFTSDKNTSSIYHSDFRSANLFRVIFTQKVRFVEVFHTIFRKDFIASAIHRRRPALYLEATDIFYALYRKLGFRSEEERKLAQKTVDFARFESTAEHANLFRSILATYAAAIGSSKWRIGLFRVLLKPTAARKLIATADSRNVFELLAACELAGIKSFLFQSGNLTKYNVAFVDATQGLGRLIKPTKMMVETGYWKKELLRVGTYFKVEEIVVGGNQKEDYVLDSAAEKALAEKTLKSRVPKNDGNLTVLIPYEIAAPKAEVLEYVRKFIGLPNVKVVFKMRADRDLNSQVREYGLEEFSNKPDTHDKLIYITDLKEIADFDIVAGVYSTFMYEMIGKFKPVGILKTSLDYGEGLIINGLADQINKDAPDILENLRRIAATKPDELERRRRILYGETAELSQVLSKILSGII